MDIIKWCCDALSKEKTPAESIKINGKSARYTKESELKVVKPTGSDKSTLVSPTGTPGQIFSDDQVGETWVYIYIYIYIYISVISRRRPKTMVVDYSCIEYMRNSISINRSVPWMAIVIYSFSDLCNKTHMQSVYNVTGRKLKLVKLSL